MSSPISAFVRERCVLGADFSVPVKELYDTYESWCWAERIETPTVSEFGRDLRVVIPSLEISQHRLNGTRGRRYQGVRLASMADEPPVTRVTREDQFMF
jgi:putative DNA primase/helicase